MKKFLSFALMLLVPMMVLAQSAHLLSLAQAEMAKRGLSETEVRARLLQEGIDVDAIQPSEYANYQGRVMDILNQMQAEKQQAANRNTAADTTFRVDATPDVAIPVTTREERVAEASSPRVTAPEPVNANSVYGHSLFTGKSLDVFRTTDGAQAPDTYVLGEGDEIHISIFGSSQTEIHQRIGADGSIQPAGSTKIFLKGMTLGQARNAIRSKLAQHYSFRPDQIAVTISTARTVSVSIYGEVRTQGGFTLSALNTAFNALAAAGGPSAIGSVREIQISRGGKTHSLDLYKYMKGDTSGAYYDLQNGDVLFVPVARKVVTVQGAVIRPMRYEVLDGETIADVIGFAGGPSLNAADDFVQLQRMEGGKLSYTDYDLRQVLSGSQKVLLQNGDVISLHGGSDNLEEQYVAVEGDVYYAGRYDVRKNRSLITLLDNAKPRYTAKTDFVFVERTKDDNTVEVITVPYPGVSGHPDFVLKARDKVTVLEQASYRDVETISVQGQVRKPFSRDFGLKDRMTISQAIEFAGGLRPTVFPVAYIFRRDVTNPEKMEYLRINLETDGDKMLQPGDRLNIYDNTTYTNVGEVHVSGAVKNSFGTPFDASLTVHDLLTMAGGLEVGAAYDKIEVFRVDISKSEQVSYETITLKVDENLNLVGQDFQLQPFDHIVVRMTPNFAFNRSVEVTGRVRYPGVYVLNDSRTQLSDVIKLAGGLLDDAEPFANIFRSFNNRGIIGINLKKMNGHTGDMAYDPILMEGDVVSIPRQENTVTLRFEGTRMGQYTPDNFASEQRTVVYQGAHSAKWYIDHYAGGFAKTADRNSVTVTYPNSQADGTGRFLFFRTYPTVQPGAVISVSIDPDKLRKLEEPKQKTDFEGIIAKSLSAITSVASIVILARNIAKSN